MTKTDFDAELPSLNRKITSNKTKHLLVKNELKKLKTFDSSCFISKSHFEDAGTENYLVFQSMYRHFKESIDFSYILEWKSKGLSDKSIKLPSAPHNVLNPSLDYFGTTIRIRFSESCLFGAASLTKNANIDKCK